MNRYGLLTATVIFVFDYSASAGDAVKAVHDFRVASLKTELSSSTGVGSKGAGLTCTPSGTLTWRNIRPEPEEVGHSIAEALSEVGLDAVSERTVIPELGPPSARLLIVATVTDVKAKLCTPFWGIGKLFGDGRKVKGSGTISLRLDVYDLRTRNLYHSFSRDADIAELAGKADRESLITKVIALAVAGAAPDLKLVAARD